MGSDSDLPTMGLAAQVCCACCGRRICCHSTAIRAVRLRPPRPRARGHGQLREPGRVGATPPRGQGRVARRTPFIGPHAWKRRPTRMCVILRPLWASPCVVVPGRQSCGIRLSQRRPARTCCDVLCRCWQTSTSRARSLWSAPTAHRSACSSTPGRRIHGASRCALPPHGLACRPAPTQSAACVRLRPLLRSSWHSHGLMSETPHCYRVCARLAVSRIGAAAGVRQRRARRRSVLVRVCTVRRVVRR